MSNPKHGSDAKAKIVRNRTQMMWYQVPAEELRDFVQDVTMAGCAVVLGRTMNGSALSVCILAGNDKQRDYIGSMDDISPVLDGLRADFEIDTNRPKF